MLFVHVAVFPTVLVLDVAPVLKIGLAVVIGTSLIWQWLHGASLMPGELTLADDGDCSLTRGGQSRAYRITRASLHTGLVRFTLKRVGTRPRILLLMHDAVEPEVYRELRARITQGHLPRREKIM